MRTLIPAWIKSSVYLPRTVVILGLVSFLNDTASEMITPLLPIFLTATLGAGPAVVGLVEGVAEATASILKLISGLLADRGFNAKFLVMGGYGLSNTVRPLICLAFAWIWVLVLRFLDRVGKGLRTSPRDALIAASINSEIRGKAFGFHRALDHAGAMLGPLLAFVLLSWNMDVHHVFLLSVIPGILVLLLLWFGLPAGNKSTSQHDRERDTSRLEWRRLDIRLRALIIATGGLALATTPEVFLVLWAQARGLEVVWIPLLWAAASGVKMLVAIPGGHLSDRYGRLQILIIGWGVRIILLVLLGISSTNSLLIWVLFLGYAASLAFTEGAERAMIGDFAPDTQKATAFGLYHMTAGLLALPGALLFGGIWQWVGENIAFYSAACLTMLAVLAVLFISKQQVR